MAISPDRSGEVIAVLDRMALWDIAGAPALHWAPDCLMAWATSQRGN